MLLTLAVVVVQMATVLVIEHRHPAKAVAWLMVLLVLPIVGFIVYIFVAKEYEQRRKVRHQQIPFTLQQRLRSPSSCATSESDVTQSISSRFATLLQNTSGFPVTCRNRSTILNDGVETYDAILAAMRQAKSHIHISFYIFRHDASGQRFKNVMLEKARKGVRIRFMYDGVGSMDLDRGFIDELKDAGVECHCFLPPIIAFLDKRLNYRNHRKIVIVDGVVGYLGGINIGDEYIGKDKKMGYWRDMHIQLEGDAVYPLQHIFLHDWEKVSGKPLLECDHYYPDHTCDGEEHVQLIPGGPDMREHAIFYLYFSAACLAVKKLWIATPYFIPDRAMIRALSAAALSGVDVRVMLPEKSDSRIVRSASLSYLEELMDVNVKFYFYRKGFMHSKLIIIDDELASIGTANLDMRSFFSNFELNALLYDQTKVQELTDLYANDLTYCEEITRASIERRSLFQKGSEVVCRLLSSLL